MTISKRTTADWLKRRINVARAEKGLSWNQIAERVAKHGASVTASSLMSKHSRSSFTAVELIFLFQILEVETLILPTDRDVSPRRKPPT